VKRCKFCKNRIDELSFELTVKTTGVMSVEDGEIKEVIDENSLSTVKEEYFCPVCERVLFTNEKDAREFLFS